MRVKGVLTLFRAHIRETLSQTIQDQTLQPKKHFSQKKTQGLCPKNTRSLSKNHKTSVQKHFSPTCSANVPSLAGCFVRHSIEVLGIWCRVKQICGFCRVFGCGAHSKLRQCVGPSQLLLFYLIFVARIFEV